MKKIAAIIMLIVCIASLVSAPALAGVMIVSNTATYDNSVAMQRNLDTAIAALNGQVIKKNELFSFNKVVGERTSENGYASAPNGNGMMVPGGGVSQVATTLKLALEKLGDKIIEVDRYSFGSAFNAGYVASGADAVLTDSSRGLDYRILNSYGEDLTISMWRSDGMVFCQLTGADSEEEKKEETENLKQEEDKQLYFVTNCKSFVNLREDASSSAAILKEIPKGAEVVFTGETHGSYMRVSYDGATGYVDEDYLTKSNPEAEMLEIVNCKHSVSLRKEPDKDSESLMGVPLGAKVLPLAKADEGFRKVEYEGEIGYIMVDYLN